MLVCITSYLPPALVARASCSMDPHVHPRGTLSYRGRSRRFGEAEGVCGGGGGRLTSRNEQKNPGFFFCSSLVGSCFS